MSVLWLGGYGGDLVADLLVVVAALACPVSMVVMNAGDDAWSPAH
jgi:hypothetical protein